jgi:hypothetical protein
MMVQHSPGIGSQADIEYLFLYTADITAGTPLASSL